MKIISFGEIIWDVYPDQSVLGGAPLNFASHAHELGAEVAFLSAIGNDELGKLAINQIKSIIHKITKFFINRCKTLTFN